MDDTPLRGIIKLIEDKKLEGDEGAYKKLETYVSSAELEGYGQEKWSTPWRRAVYRLGELTGGMGEGGRFIGIIDEAILKRPKDNEALEFLKSEIVWGYFPPHSIHAFDYFIDLVRRYPANPEFHHSYSHYLEKRGDHVNAIDECRLAQKIEPRNDIFKGTGWNREKGLVDSLLEKGDIEGAERRHAEMLNFSGYVRDITYGSITIMLRDRLQDHKIIRDKIAQIDEVIRSKTEEDRKRLIEILGIFTAIVSFVFANINILSKGGWTLGEGVRFMTFMALIFLAFAISISYLFARDKEYFYTQGKFWILVGILGFLGLASKFII